MWERIRKQIGLEEITPYYLQHNVATMLREAEVDIKATQSIMGHANAEVTLEVYSHLTDKQIRTAAEKMEEYLEHSGG